MEGTKQDTTTEERAFKEYLRQLKEVKSRSVDEREAKAKWDSLNKVIKDRFRVKVKVQKVAAVPATPAKKKSRKRKGSELPPTSSAKRPFVVFSHLEGDKLDKSLGLAAKARELTRRWAEMDQEQRDKYKEDAAAK